MLKMRRLELRNFLRHEQLVLSFPPSGIVTVLGPNGCGKSAVIRAIIFALTGVLDINKEHALRWGTDEGHVSLDFALDDGVTYTVTRKLGSSSATLKSLDGKVDLRSATKISEFMTNKVGVDAHRARFCLVGQGRLTELLDATKAARTEAFNALFRNDDFDDVYEALGGFIGSVAPVDSHHAIEMFEEAVNTERTSLTYISALVDGSASEYAAARAALGTSVDQAMMHVGMATTVQSELSKPQNHIPTLLERLAGLKDAVLADERAVIGFSATAARLAEDVTSYAAKYTDKFPVKSKLEDELRVATELATLQPELDQQQSKLADAESEVRVLSEALTTSAASVAAAVDDRTRASTEHASVAELLNRLGTDGRCPTCTTTEIVGADGFRSNLKQLSADLVSKRDVLGARLQEANDRHSKLVLTHAAAQANLLRGSSNLSQLKAAVAFKSARIEQLRALAPASVERLTMELRRLSDDLQQFKLQEKQARDQLRAAEQAVAGRNMAIASNRAEATQLQANIDRLIALAQSDAAKLDIASLRAKVKAVQDSEQRLASEKAELAKLSTSVAKLEGELSSRKINLAVENRRAELVGVVTLVRQLFHKSQMPTQLSSIFLGDLNAAWNDTLRLLDVPFTVNVQPNFDIILHFADSDVRTIADAASGGQRCCLSLALLLAINRVFFSNFGVMVLDEPTYGLDHAHVDRLVELMLRVNEAAGDSGLQIVVVSHENRFKTGFEHCIELS